MSGFNLFHGNLGLESVNVKITNTYFKKCVFIIDFMFQSSLILQGFVRIYLMTHEQNKIATYTSANSSEIGFPLYWCNSDLYSDTLEFK